MGAGRRRGHVTERRLDEGRRCHYFDRSRRRRRIFTCRFQGPWAAVGREPDGRGVAARRHRPRLEPIMPELAAPAIARPRTPDPCHPKSVQYPTSSKEKPSPTHPAPLSTSACLPTSPSCPRHAVSVGSLKWSAREHLDFTIIRQPQPPSPRIPGFYAGQSTHQSVTRYSSNASIFFMSPSSMENPPTSPFSAILALFTLLGSGT